MSPVEARLRLPSGTDAYTVTWASQTGQAPGRASYPPVVMVHGFGEHCRRYDWLGSRIAGAGFTVMALDLRGHGRSSGAPGDVGALADALDDVQAFYAQAVEAVGAGPGFLVGHSMGGALAAALAVTSSVALRGLVLSAPAVHLSMLPAYQARVARWVGRAWPLAPVGRVDPRTISTEADEQALYASDPLVRPRVPVRAALTMHDAGNVALAGAPSLSLPVLVVHGEEDTLVPLAASRRLEAAIGSPDTTLVTFPGCRHEVHHDRGREDLVATLVGWLASRS